MQTVQGGKECFCGSNVILRCDGIINKPVVQYKEGIKLHSTSFSSIEHTNAFAMSGPIGEPIATPSACSYNLPSIWNS